MLPNLKILRNLLLTDLNVSFKGWSNSQPACRVTKVVYTQNKFINRDIVTNPSMSQNTNKPTGFKKNFCSGLSIAVL